MDLNSSDRLNVNRTRRKTSTISNSILHEFSSRIITQGEEEIADGDETFTFKEAVPQIIASMSATSFHIIVGVTFAATATLLPQIKTAESGINATEWETAWIASVFVLAVPITSLFSGFIMDKIGRLNTVRFSVIPAVASCIVIAKATNPLMLIGGRCLMGIATAFGTNPAVVYITDTTSSDYRGPLVSSGPTLSSLGMMLGYLFGAVFPWRLVSWINVSFCAVPVVLLLIFRVPESPTWLYIKGREDEAKKTLEWIARWKTEESKKKYVDERMGALKRSADANVRHSENFWQKVRGFKEPTGYRPLIIFLIFFAFQQYCGVYLTTIYAVQIFEGAGSSMNPFYASILIGLIRFVMSVVTTVLLKHYKRRIMCLVSASGMAVMMAISGFFTQKALEQGEGSMIPVICILAYVCFSMIGLLSLPWTMAAEVFPDNIRALGHGLLIGGAHVFMFISVQTFFDMVRFFGGFAHLQWFFAIMSVLAFIFLYYCLPETHNRDLLDITEYFKNNTFYISRKKKSSAEKNKNKNWEKSNQIMHKKEIKPLTSPKGLDMLEEYDTFLLREEEKYPTIVTTNNERISFGKFDLNQLEYIDKSVEMLADARKNESP